MKRIKNIVVKRYEGNIKIQLSKFYSSAHEKNFQKLTIFTLISPHQDLYENKFRNNLEKKNDMEYIYDTPII